jgi:mono/diheme cytochrome c family protein
VVVKVFAENETGLELWSGTVDLPPGKSVRLAQRVWLDADTTTLVATATLEGVADEDPTDNQSRGGLGLRGRAALVLVGRSLHLARCAACHGDDAAGGSGPSIVGATGKEILLKAAAGGDHDVPWLSRRDARDLGLFLRDPGGAILPPPLPTPPPGGWPTYTGSVKTLLDARCISCHGAFQANGGVRLDSYKSASANARRALYDARIGKMPQGGKRFTPTEVALLQDWIDGGRRP